MEAAALELDQGSLRTREITMPVDTNNLMQNVYDYFLNLYNSSQSQNVGDTFLSFETIGHPVSTRDFKIAGQTAYSPQLAIEHFSDIANYVPNFASQSFKETASTVEDLYEMILTGAQPVSAADADLAFFAQLKTLAQKRFDEQKIGALSGPYQFHPCYADPVDWYDPSNQSNWVAHSFSLAQPNSTPTPAPLPAPAKIGGVSAVWRGGPTAAHVASAVQTYPHIAAKLSPAVQRALPIAVHSATAGKQPAHAVTAAKRTNLATPAMRATVISTHAVAPLRKPAPSVATHSGAAAAPVVKTAVKPAPHPIAPSYKAVLFDPHINFNERAQIQTALLKVAPSKPVSSANFSISFRYCIVRVRRTWLYEPFLFDKNWYIPGYKDGSFSSGTGRDNAGIFPAVPIALVAVKDLQITANWSDADAKYAQNAMAFGPFSLAGSNFDNNALSCGGTQVIAWIFNVLPLLPVNADPSTKSKSILSQVVSAVGDVAQILEPAPSSENKAAATTALKEASDIVADGSAPQHQGDVAQTPEPAPSSENKAAATTALKEASDIVADSSAPHQADVA
jgi:hypothetical protein